MALPSSYPFAGKRLPRILRGNVTHGPEAAPLALVLLAACVSAGTILLKLIVG